MQLILIRHGETDWNKQSRYLGNTDLPLNEKGLQQVAEIASLLKTFQPNVLYSSDLIRANQTARLIEKIFSLPLHTDKRLREINFGLWEGKTYAELSDKERVLSANWFNDPNSITIPGGESWQKFQSRVLAFLQEIIPQHRNEKVIVVSHGGPIKIIIAHFLGVSGSKISHLQISPASINVVDIYDQKGFLKLLNWRPKLEFFTVQF